MNEEQKEAVRRFVAGIPIEQPTAAWTALTAREKWLMERAYSVGFIDCSTRIRNRLEDWLEQSAADGVTVEMVLAKEAP